jgi:flavin-dependent dehydrogenase
VDGEGIHQATKSGKIATKTIIDPKWNYKPELQDLLKYHRYGRWIIPCILVFPKLSQSIIEGQGGMLMPVISTIVTLADSVKFIQRVAFGIIGKWTF